MAKPETLDIAAQIAQSPQAGRIQEQLSALLLKRMLKEEQAEEDLVNQRELGRQQMLLQTQQAEAASLLEQKTCPHRKPNGHSSLGGQKDSNGNLHLICLSCQKEFDHVPQGHVLYDHVGGPQ